MGLTKFTFGTLLEPTTETNDSLAYSAVMFAE